MEKAAAHHIKCKQLGEFLPTCPLAIISYYRYLQIGIFRFFLCFNFILTHFIRTQLKVFRFQPITQPTTTPYYFYCLHTLFLKRTCYPTHLFKLAHLLELLFTGIQCLLQHSWRWYYIYKNPWSPTQIKTQMVNKCVEDQPWSLTQITTLRAVVEDQPPDYRFI